MARLRKSLLPSASLVLILTCGCATPPVGEDVGYHRESQTALCVLSGTHDLDYIWDPVTETARLKGHGNDLIVAPGSRIALLDGRSVDLGAPAEVSSGRVQSRAFGTLLEGRSRPPREDRTEPPTGSGPTYSNWPEPEVADHWYRQEPVEVPVQPVHESIHGPTVRHLVVIDPGHGGADPGATLGKIYEKDIVLPICLRAARILEAEGIQVVLTRSTDQKIDLEDRARFASRKRATIFVSVHVNACATGNVHGIETIYTSQVEVGPASLKARSRSMGKTIHQGLVRTMGGQAHDRGTRPDSRGLRVLRKNTVPAVLVELGFLTNSREARRLVDSAYQETLAKGLARGIADHVKR